MRGTIADSRLSRLPAKAPGRPTPVTERVASLVSTVIA